MSGEVPCVPLFPQRDNAAVSFLREVFVFFLLLLLPSPFPFPLLNAGCVFLLAIFLGGGVQIDYRFQYFFTLQGSKNCGIDVEFRIEEIRALYLRVVSEGWCAFSAGHFCNTADYLSQIS